MAGAAIFPSIAGTLWCPCPSSPRSLRFSPLPRSSFLAYNAPSHLGSRSHFFILSRDWLRLSKGTTRGVVHASLLGVGAPEALVIAVVALLVFGPKGLAEVARTLGKSFRAFQPTIRELQQISREFKDTLEQEIGLDDLRAPPQAGMKSDQKSPPPNSQNGPIEQKAYSTEDYLRITEEQAKALVPEEQRRAAEAAAWAGTPPTVNVEASKEQIRNSEEASNNAGLPHNM